MPQTAPSVRFRTHNGSFAETREFPGIPAREARNLLRACGLTAHQARAVLNNRAPAMGTWTLPGTASLPLLPA
jgi:hypothetical protein